MQTAHWSLPEWTAFYVVHDAVVTCAHWGNAMAIYIMECKKTGHRDYDLYIRELMKFYDPRRKNL